MRGRRPSVWFVLAALWLGGVCSGTSPFPPDQSKTLGKQVPDVQWTSDRGERFSMRSLQGKPLLLSPIFTRCKFTCSPITKNLKDALPPDWRLGKDYSILTFSFDPEDTPAKMAALRERHSLPPEWLLATGDEPSVRALLQAIDFRTLEVEEEGFAHANVVVALDAQQRAAFYLLGVTQDSALVDQALQVASGRAFLGEPLRIAIILGSIFGIIGCGAFLGHKLATRRSQ